MAVWSFIRGKIQRARTRVYAAAQTARDASDAFGPEIQAADESWWFIRGLWALIFRR